MLLQLYWLQQKQKTEQKEQSNRLTEGERRNWSVTKFIVEDSIASSSVQNQTATALTLELPLVAFHISQNVTFQNLYQQCIFVIMAICLDYKWLKTQNI